MTAEEYYWYVRRPQLLRARAAGMGQVAPVQLVTIALTMTDGTCTFKINGEECESKQVPVGSNVTIQVIPDEDYELVKWSDDSTEMTRTITNIQSNVNLNAKLQVAMTFNGTWFPVPTSSSISQMTWDATNKRWNGTFGEFNAELKFTRQRSDYGKWIFEQISGSSGMEFDVDETAPNAKTLHTRAGGGTTLQWAPVGMTIVSLSSKDGTCKFKINGEECNSKVVQKGSDVTIEVIPDEGYEFVYWNDRVTDKIRTISNVQDVVSFTAQLQIPATKGGVWSENGGSSEVMYLTWDNEHSKWTGLRHGHDIELLFDRINPTIGSWTFIEDVTGGGKVQYVANEQSPSATVLHARNEGDFEVHWFNP